MEPRSTEDLVTRATRGHSRALDELVAANLPALVAYLRLHARGLLLQRGSCADLAQSVCREVLEHAGSFEFRGEAPFRKWLFQKALSKIVDRQRYWLADKRTPAREELDGSADVASSATPVAELLASFATPSQVAIRNEDFERLERAFDQLPDEYREVLTRARLYGESHEEIARDLGKSEGATRVLLHRALARLGYLMSHDGSAGR
jgi:RNA polymerase sigma-70 factor (ECF subfamily)